MLASHKPSWQLAGMPDTLAQGAEQLLPLMIARKGKMLEKTQMSSAEKIPPLHPQWAALSFGDILSQPTAWLAIGQSNSILSKFGAQSAEGLWERSRKPGGSLSNTLKLEAMCRQAGIKTVWFRYEIFRDNYPGTPMDRAQWSYWTNGKDWSAIERARDADFIEEVKERIQ